MNTCSHVPLRENYERTDAHREDRSSKRQTVTRPDMKGPSDITDILSGLKTKTINISEAPQRDNFSEEGFPDNNSSTISINDLKEIQTEANVPKRSKRKPKSDKNTVSLDI